tara:strand:+ start:228 stop:443 length:216 start_codon:yes stop_codon:yes gene_type:complete
MNKELIKILNKVFKENIKIVKPNFDLRNLKNYDSLKYMEFVLLIEKKFKLKINKKNLNKFYSYKNLQKIQK